MIQAKELVKTFIRHEKKNKKIAFQAVDHVSLTVSPGEIVGILGPNGAGKTTLLRMLASLLSPTEGEVIVQQGEAVIKDPVEIKKHIGYLSGNTKLYQRFSIREMLSMFGTLYGLDAQTIEKRTEEICEILNLSAFIDNRIEKLSTGQTQRASISRCLIHDPEVYIFDEPTLGLDILSSSAIIEFMKQEKLKGKTIIYSTHYMEEAEYLCDRIIMLNKGRVICDLTPDKLMEETETSSIREAFYEMIRREDMKNE